jgi:diguanylate cyclase (GGDEF)-like protein
MRDNVTIAIIAPLKPEDFFDLLWQGVWEATFDLSSFSVEVQNLTTQHADVQGQRRILETLLDSPPDAIGLLPVHVSALDDLIDRHALRGTPVITFQSDAPNSKRAAFVGPNPYQAGVLAGEVLAKLVRGQGRILAFPGSLDEFHLTQRYQGFRHALRRTAVRIEEAPTLFRGATLADIPPPLTPQLLEDFGPVAGYYAGNDRLAQIAVVLEKSAQKLGFQAPCIGFSDTEQIRPLLERGVISAVVDENRYQLGYFAVQKAYEAGLKRERDAAIASVQIPSTVVFAANARGAGDSLDSAFELLVRQRTEILVSYKKRLEEANLKLQDLAITDPLTGLYNRRKFDETLNQEVNRARRYGPVSVLIVDLDYLKLINDRHGHQAGDGALKAAAQVLQSSCRTTDTCARLGGDEFGIILPHADSGAADMVRQRIQQQFAQTLVAAAGGDLTISVSIGAATLPADASTAADLIAAADAAMYEAKRTSRLERTPAVESRGV